MVRGREWTQGSSQREKARSRRVSDTHLFLNVRVPRDLRLIQRGADRVGRR